MHMLKLAFVRRSDSGEERRAGIGCVANTLGRCYFWGRGNPGLDCDCLYRGDVDHCSLGAMTCAGEAQACSSRVTLPIGGWSRFFAALSELPSNSRHAHVAEMRLVVVGKATCWNLSRRA
jgi:hypothetical protein